ncbi:MAG: HD domain-containing phosphohydrolase [Candidatus Gastranaerophilaceae bacterium]
MINKDILIKQEKEILYNKTMTSNPISGSGFMPRFGANVTSRPTSNRLYGGYNNLNNNIVLATTDYREIISSISASLKGKTNPSDFYSSLNSLLTRKMGAQFTAVGLYQEKSKCINIKLTDKVGGTYSSRVFLSDDTNPIVEAFNSQEMVIKNDSKFLKLSYLQCPTVAIIPLMSVTECLGVMIIGDNKVEEHSDLYSLIASHYALFMHNSDLIEQTKAHANTDTLTSLSNHRGFQEILSSELEKAEKSNSTLSVIMMDVNNISKINRELGHAKGDEVIKLVAEKVKQNIRSNDKAGRYGGDEIAIVLPDTDTNEAKYLAEFLTYSLSCCFIDDVGPVKVSVGIANYPQCAKEQEKLLVSAEQAMYISQSKGYKDGMSAIISASDFNFWDDMALHSFAEVLTKRHSQLGVNFEEELVNKFASEEISSQHHLEELAASLASAIDAKDPYTKGHSTSVSKYSEALARALNMPEHEVQRIRLGALLHDVGKIGIPESVLKKPTHLSDEEWEIMKQHPTIGAEKVLMQNEALKDLMPMVKYHHEHYDGTGYPCQLKGEEIPLEARIVAVADTYHALISDRPYRKGLGVEKACEILQSGAGTQWDAELVRAFIQIAPALATTI